MAGESNSGIEDVEPFREGDEKSRKKLNSMLSAIKDHEKTLKKTKGKYAPTRFDGCLNGMPAQWEMQALLVEIDLGDEA